MNHKQAAKFWINLFATLPARILATGPKPTQAEIEPEALELARQNVISDAHILEIWNRVQTEKAIEELAKTDLREYYEGNR